MALQGTVAPMARWGLRATVGRGGFAAVLLLLVSLSACGTSTFESGVSTSTTAGETTSTSSTVPSILPGKGTIPGADLEDASNPADIIATAQRALAEWTTTQTPCYPSKAEALAARDQFARVASYLAKARLASRAIQSLAAFKEVIEVEADYREMAGKLTFVSCTAGTPKSKKDKTKSTTTTTPEGNTNGLTAGGVAEVDLSISGSPKVDSTFTIADLGAPCDGLSANTTFLVSSRDASGRWVITDVVTRANGETSAVITPTRAGPGAIEYLAYCGTADKRHGVATFNVKAAGDTTIADLGAPCDGLSANTTFLVSSRDASGRWVITDVVTRANGETSAVITPTRAGPGAIEYLAYCGTADKRHGVATFNVKAAGDTTTTSPAPTTTNPLARLVVLDLPTSKSANITIEPGTAEVAIEPATVAAYLAQADALGGVVVARLNQGDWVALSSSSVTWLPVGTGDAGLDVRVVGAKAAVETSFKVEVPTPTTIASTTTAVTTPTEAKENGAGNSNSKRDTTLWVVLILVGLAAFFVVLTRLAQRRH